MPAKSVASGSTSSSTPSGKRARTSSDALGSALSSLDQGALDDLLELLSNDPKKIMPTLRFAQKADFDRTEKTSVNTHFHETYRKLYRLPKDFLRQYLCELVSGKDVLSEDDITLLEKGEDGVSRKMFFHATHTSTDTAWPSHCHDKATFKSVFATAHSDLGSQLNKIQKVAEGTSLKVDWKKWGCYILQPSNTEEKTHILHVRTGVTAQLDAPIKSYEVRENWHDLKAQIKIKRSWTDFIDYFEETERNEAVNKYRENKLYLETLAAKAYVARPAGEMTTPVKPPKDEGAENVNSDDGEPSPPASPAKGAKRKAQA